MKTGPEISPGPVNQAQRTTNAPNGVPYALAGKTGQRTG